MKSVNKKVLVLYVALSVLIVVAAVSLLWPAASRVQADAYLKQAVTQELLPLVPAVSALRGREPESKKDCSERSVSKTSLVTRTLWCRDGFYYRYDNNPRTEPMRKETIQKASVLDEQLRQRGWEPTRPDKATSIVDAIPTSPLEAFHGNDVTYRKEAHDVRCLLTVSFTGPTQGVSPGLVNVTDFSCMRTVDFFSPHIPQFTKQGYVPV